MIISDDAFPGLAPLFIIEVFLPLTLGFLILFFVLLFFFSVGNKRNKFYMRSKWKRLLTAFLLSIILCPILFYVYVVVLQISTGAVQLR